MIKKILFISINIMLASMAYAASDDWWDAAWKYRLQVKVTEKSGTPLQDYQVAVDLGKRFDYDKALRRGEDIRFIDSGRELPYWIEEWDPSGKKARIWVKVDSIPAGGKKTIYMYYGNSGAADAGDPDSVFDYYDGFSGRSLDSGKWDVVENIGGTITIRDGYLVLLRPASVVVGRGNIIDIESRTSFLGPKIIESRQRVTTPDYYFSSVYYGSPDSYSSIGYSLHSQYESALYTGKAKHPIRSGSSGSQEGDIVASPQAGVWFTEKYISSDKEPLSRSMDKRSPERSTRYKGIAGGRIGIYATSAMTVSHPMELDVDYIRVRKYANPEPNVSIGEMDLSITRDDISVTWSGNDSYSIKAAVRIDGDESASDVLVRLYDGDPAGGGKALGDYLIDVIENGSSKEAVYEKDFYESKEIYVEADADGSYAETDEENNVASKKVSVRPKEDETPYLLIGAAASIILLCLLGFASYLALSYKKPAGENIECRRCGMALPKGTRNCPVCGGEIK